MSENEIQKKSKAPLIATVIVAVLAVAAVIALVVVLNSEPKEEDSLPEESGFVLTSEFQRECEYAAHDLISESYEIKRLFVFEGLSYMSEPYGNEPEDGLYTVFTEDNEKYQTLEDIEELVRSVYTDEAANKVLHDIDGNGLEVYKKRIVLVEAEYDDSEPGSDESRPTYVEAEVLGINAKFNPDFSRRELWANCKFLAVPTSETNCDVKIYLGVVEEVEDLSELDESTAVDLKMVKTADGWRFTEFVC